MNQKSMLIEGLSDAVGFMGGALLGFGIGRLLNLDIFANGYSTGAIVGIMLVGLGGGFGLQAARRWRSDRGAKNSSDKAD